MKTKYLIISAIALLGAMSSCTEDWLATESHDSLLINEYYSTEARIYEALVAAYDPLHWYDFNGNQYCPLPVVYDVMGDDLYAASASATDQLHFHLAFNYTSIPSQVPHGAWDNSYSGINRANSVAAYMPNVQNISDKNKALYLAEAAVLRTYYYNILWKLWGNVPYYETNLESPYIRTQNTADEVYEFMIAALEDAMDNGGLPMKVTDSAFSGRVSWAMAAMLYAEIVMYQNDTARYPKALGYMEDIIDSGQYDLMDNYGDIFEQTGEWSEESIFEINYVSEGSIRAFSGGEKNYGGTIYPHMIAPEGLTNSSRFAVSGWGTGVVTPMAAAIFTDGDLRKFASVFEPRAEGADYKARYQDTGYFLAKYITRPDSRTGNRGAAEFGNNNNLRVYRFSETLLNAAELGSSSAQAYLDRIRTRAGLGSIAANKDNIIDERHREFMGEGKRYFDLVRSGKAESVLTPANDLGGWRTNSWTPSKKYLPIPQSEIDAAQGSLVQNNY